MLIKIANSDFILDVKNEIPAEKALNSAEITNRFYKLASEIKKVAPRSGEFIYFIARGIHAMEHAAIDPVTRQYNSKLGHIAHSNEQGFCKECGIEVYKTSRGEPISGLWCRSSQVEPWINQNGDAFPESELLAEVKDPKDSTRTIKAYQTFIGKGLFTDHKSSEVENIRGIILDAEYDFNTKGVDLLIALDKINYPELARQVSAGYSAQVSMGTQVNYSLCSICGNKAVTEHDYCDHVRAGKGLARAGSARCYEVNNGLNFIELSVVGNAADPRARIRTIIAQAQNLKQNLQQNSGSETFIKENQLIFDSIIRLESQIKDLQSQLEKTASESKIQEQSFTSEILSKISTLEDQVNKIGGRLMSQKSQEKKAYMQGTVEPDLSKTFEMSDKNYTSYWEDDKHLHGQGMESGDEGLHPGYGMGADEDVKKMYQRASAEERRQIRKALLEKAKTAYMQGTVEPDLSKPFEMADKNYKQYWEDDKHLHGQGMESGDEGLHPGYGMGSDEQVKKELLRAKLRAKLEKFANPSQNKWTLFAGEQPVLAVTAETAYGSELKTAHNTHGTNQQWFDSKDYGLNLIKAVKTIGLNEVKARVEAAGKVTTAQATAPEMPPATPEATAPEATAPEATAPEAATPEMPSATPEVEEMSAAEGIKAAAERIESAKDEILSLTESLAGEEKAAGEQLAGELGAAGEELGGLGAEMGTSMPAAQASVYKRLVRYALANADQVLSQAETFVENLLDQDAVEKIAKKKLPEGLRKHLEKKKKDKKALSDEELKIRKEARRLVAQKLYDLTDGDMIAEAHPEGGNTTTFPENPEGRIETVTEAQEKDIEVANSMPRGELVARQHRRTLFVESAAKAVKIAADAAQTAQKAKAAEDAQKLADQKKKELEEATKQASTQSTKTAEADKETKQYYKELASESATGQKPDPAVSKFYTELTQDFHKKASTAAAHDYGLKMKRAFAVAYKRAQLGQIENTEEAISADVDRLIHLDDESFTAFADLVNNTKKVKAEVTPSKQVRTAGALQVGVNEVASASFGDQLSKLPWK